MASASPWEQTNLWAVSPRRKAARRERDSIPPTDDGAWPTVVVDADGHVHPKTVAEAAAAARPAEFVADPSAGGDDSVVAANRLRINELRQRRYGVPDFADIVGGGRGRAVALLMAGTAVLSFVARVAWPGALARGLGVVLAVAISATWLAISVVTDRRRRGSRPSD